MATDERFHHLGSGRGRGGGAEVHRRCVVVVLIAVLVVAAGCSSAKSATRPTHHAANGLVGYPSFLPKSSLHVRSDAELVGTAKRPALTSQGDRVKVVTPRSSVVAVVRGPEVPGEGLPYQSAATTCTWAVTLTDATGPVPIAVADFDSINLLGDVFHPNLVARQPAPPSTLFPGRSVSFELRAGESVGEGLMRWAPIGGRIVAKWDFVVEND